MLLVLSGEHRSPEFLKLNPHGDVPVLVDGETSVFEACAILRYLAYKYSNHKDFGSTMAEKMKVILTLLSIYYHGNFISKSQMHIN